MTQRFNRIHAICQRLHDEPCERCPASFVHPEFGRCQRGCYGLAQEVLNIAQHGSPWGPKQKRRYIRSWQKRIREKGTDV